MYDKLSIVDLAKNRMDWVARRQEVLAENIANANTPKYQPRDLKEFDFKAVLKQTDRPVRVATTNPLHVQAPVQNDPQVLESRKTYESSQDGNAVVLEEQMAKLGSAKSTYDIAASMFQKQFAMMKTALGKGGAA
jgi:flagellar basal-body rod protein FlgB